jgi:hypothetical protein
MTRIPRYGVHDGIKYSPRRTLIRFCEICGEPFISIGHGKKYCSEACYMYTKKKHMAFNSKKYNNKWNPINNPKRDATEEERRNRINQWKVWYANLTPEQRQKYNHKKKSGATKKEDTYDSIQAEMKALGLR